jgi:hypothetical protein
MPRSLPSKGNTVALCNTERLISSTLKREVLLFDKLGFSDLPSLLAVDFFPDYKKAELTQLYRGGHIVDVEFAYDESLEKDPLLKDLYAELSRSQDNHQIDPRQKPMYTAQAKRVEDAKLRVIAAEQNALGAMQAVTLFSTSADYERTFGHGKAQVLEIVLKTMPEPDASVPWEQIDEFKSDPDSKAKSLGLKVWVNDVARAKLPPTEIAEKLEWCLQEYEQHMRFHGMKINHGTLKTVVTVAAEIVEDVAKFTNPSLI